MKKLLFVILVSLSLLSCEKVDEDFEAKPKVEIVKPKFYEIICTITSTYSYPNGIPIPEYPNVQKHIYVVPYNNIKEFEKSNTYTIQETVYSKYGKIKLTIESKCTKRLIYE